MKLIRSALILKSTHIGYRPGSRPHLVDQEMKGRMDVIHFKDMMMYQGKQAMAEVGEGNLNWPGIIDACRETECGGLLWSRTSA